MSTSVYKQVMIEVSSSKVEMQQYYFGNRNETEDHDVPKFETSAQYSTMRH